MIEHLVGFVETKSEILKLEIKEELAKIISRMLAWVVIVLLIALFCLFLSVALGNYLNGLWNSTYLGFAAVSGLFFLLWMVVLVLKRTSWYHHLMNKLTHRILERLDDELNQTGNAVKSQDLAEAGTGA